MKTSAWRRFLTQYGNVSALVLLSAAFALAAPAFATQANATQILEQTARNAILAVGMTCVILTGGIDLSVGSVLALAGIVSGLVLAHGAWLPLGLAAGLGVGLACGCINGVLTALLGLPPFIATLGMMSAAHGGALMASGGQPISGFSPAFLSLWEGSLAGIPAPILVVGLVYVCVWWLLERTPFGLHVYAIGGNAKAAWLAGVDVKRTTIGVYMISGALAGLTSLLLTARLNTAAPTAGGLAELEAIAATVIGGTSLSGGEGRLLGTLSGALIMGVLRNGLNLLDVSTYAQSVVIGLVIVVAVFVDRLTHGR